MSETMRQTRQDPLNLMVQARDARNGIRDALTSDIPLETV